MSFELSRRQNADLYGPTTGDAVRLGDTDLFAEIERDLTHHGEEAVFGGGKVIRDGMGHNGRAVRADGADLAAAVAAAIVGRTAAARAARSAAAARTARAGGVRDARLARRDLVGRTDAETGALRLPGHRRVHDRDDEILGAARRHRLARREIGGGRDDVIRAVVHGEQQT